MTQVIDGKLVSISGHYQNPNDVEALKTLPTDVDARNAFLDDEEAPADPAPAPAAPWTSFARQASESSRT